MEEPKIKPIEKVTSSTLVGLCLGGTFFMVVLMVIMWFCYRRRRINAKRHGPEQPLAFHTHRKPTAVKSPAGATTHYLKKSPSPTGPSKTPPGVTVPVPHTSSPSFEALDGGMMVTGPLESGVGLLDGMVLPDDALEKKSSKPPAEEFVNQEEEEYPQENFLGELVFKLKYKAEKNAFIVTIVRCMELPGKDPNHGSCDPYVKLQLLPDKQHKVKTRVLRNTQDPMYDEDFTFYGITQAQLPNITLHFVVLSFDRYSRDDIIGEVFFSMENMSVEQLERQQVAISEHILPRSLKIRTQGRGELLVSLCWQPAASRLTVVVLKARNLPRMDISGLADPYVKIYLVYRGQRIAKKKTHVKKRTLSPVFNESFVFDLPPCGFNGEGFENSVCLEFLLLDWDRVTKNEVIGRLNMGGSKCTGTALHHWKEVSNSARRQIADWHKLRE